MTFNNLQQIDQALFFRWGGEECGQCHFPALLVHQKMCGKRAGNLCQHSTDTQQLHLSNCSRICLEQLSYVKYSYEGKSNFYSLKRFIGFSATVASKTDSAKQILGRCFQEQMNFSWVWNSQKIQDVLV